MGEYISKYRTSTTSFLSPNIFNLELDEREEINHTSSVISLGWYFPSGKSWEEKFNKAKLPDKQDEWSYNVSALKGYKTVELQDRYIQYFAGIIYKLITPNINIMVIAVPSSTARNTAHGVTRLAQAIADKQPSHIACGNHLLLRTETVPSSHSGYRIKYTHEKTIAVTNPAQIRGKTILLIDDVVTTGTVIEVCREKLKKSGAAKVVCLTLGRTVSSDRYRHCDFPILPLCELNQLPHEILHKNLTRAKRWYNETLATHHKLSIL